MKETSKCVHTSLRCILSQLCIILLIIEIQDIIYLNEAWCISIIYANHQNNTMTLRIANKAWSHISSRLIWWLKWWILMRYKVCIPRNESISLSGLKFSNFNRKLQLSMTWNSTGLCFTSAEVFTTSSCSLNFWWTEFNFWSSMN